MDGLIAVTAPTMPRCAAASLHFASSKPVSARRCPRGRQRAPRRKYNTRAHSRRVSCRAPGLGKAQHKKSYACRASHEARTKVMSCRVSHELARRSTMARLLTALALVASAGAFAPAATQTRSASALSAYVPQGLSASEYAAKKAADT